MKKKISKSEAQEQIKEFFESIKEKSPKQVKKIKKLAMAYNIKLGEKRKVFCKKCLRPYVDFGIKIKKGILTITCGKCESKSRWKVK